jgi:hypothetical protein
MATEPFFPATFDVKFASTPGHGNQHVRWVGHRSADVGVMEGQVSAARVLGRGVNDVGATALTSDISTQRLGCDLTTGARRRTTTDYGRYGQRQR